MFLITRPRRPDEQQDHSLISSERNPDAGK